MELTVTTTPDLLMKTGEANEFLHLDAPEPELQLMMRSIQEKAEAYVGKSFTQRTIILKLDRIAVGGVVELPRYPVTSITSIATLDEDDVSTTVLASTYYMADERRLIFKEDPNITRDYGGLVITYVAGLASRTPDAMKTGMLKALSTIFEHREDFAIGTTVIRLPDQSKSYLDTWRSLC